MLLSDDHISSNGGVTDREYMTKHVTEVSGSESDKQQQWVTDMDQETMLTLVFLTGVQPNPSMSPSYTAFFAAASGRQWRGEWGWDHQSGTSVLWAWFNPDMAEGGRVENIKSRPGSGWWGWGRVWLKPSWHWRLFCHQTHGLYLTGINSCCLYWTTFRKPLSLLSYKASRSTLLLVFCLITPDTRLHPF